jgi:hypothetical protein
MTEQSDGEDMSEYDTPSGAVAFPEK